MDFESQAVLGLYTKEIPISLDKLNSQTNCQSSTIVMQIKYIIIRIGS